jgi:phage shock protein E
VSRVRVIIDVREPEEYESSHVEGAINLPLSKIVNGELPPEQIEKSQEITVYCNSGNRSSQAQYLLQELGYSNVVNGINQSHIEQSKVI